MVDSSAPNDAQSRQQSVDAVANAPAVPDDENLSLLLRPAEFDHLNGSLGTASPQVPQAAPVALSDPSTHPLRHRVPGPGRVPLTIKSRELLELAGNPFMPNPHAQQSVEGHLNFRQDIYPAYDATSGRRIGLDRVHNTEERHEPKAQGYYRKHVHEYDNARHCPRHGAQQPASAPAQQPAPAPAQQPAPAPAQQPAPAPAQQPAPAPAQVPVQSNYPENGPLPPVSAVLSGLPPDSHFGVGTFSHIQNRPRTPHEVLGLPPGVPLNLWSLRDPTTPDGKPQYNYHVLVKLAILGNKGQKATLQEILRAIRLRFPYYENLQKSEAIAFGNSIRHLLSLLAAFVREPKPVTEPGKGAYWRVDFSKGEGNKRVRKRNKPQKKQGEKQNSPSGSDNSEPNGASASSKSPALQSPTETQPTQDVFRYRAVSKGGRKPAPKNLVSLPDGGTATIPIPAPHEDPYSRVDTSMMSSATQGSEQYRSEPYLQLHPSSAGAHRERVTRGASRSAPYPSTLSMPRSGSASGSASGSEHESQYSPRLLVNQHYGTGRRTSESPIRDDSPPPSTYQSRQSGFPGTSNFRGYERGSYHGPAFAPRHSQSNSEHYGSVSPLDSPVVMHPGLPSALYPNQNMRGAHSQSRFPRQFAQNTATFPMPTPPATGYNSSAFATSSNSGSLAGPSSSMSQGSGFLRYAAQPSRLAEVNTIHRSREVGRHESDMYSNSASWQAANSSRAHR